MILSEHGLEEELSAGGNTDAGSAVKASTALKANLICILIHMYPRACGNAWDVTCGPHYAAIM